MRRPWQNWCPNCTSPNEVVQRIVRVKFKENSEYTKNYSEDSFWTKLGKYAATAGKEVVEKALMLFEALKD